MHYLLFYEVSPDYLERRGDFRGAHLKLAWEAHERGELILGGALGAPVDTSLLLFQGESAAVAERFAEADPYVKNGLVKRRFDRTRWRKNFLILLGSDLILDFRSIENLA